MNLSSPMLAEQAAPPKAPIPSSDPPPAYPRGRHAPSFGLAVREAPPPRRWKTITDPPRV